MRAAFFAGALVWSVYAAATAASLTAEVDDLHVEVRSEPDRPVTGRETTYTLRLVDAAGKPVTGARVTLTGRMADGMTVLAPLRPASEAGIYRGRVMFTMEGQWELRVRVTAKGKTFELPLSEKIKR